MDHSLTNARIAQLTKLPLHSINNLSDEINVYGGDLLKALLKANVKEEPYLALARTRIYYSLSEAANRVATLTDQDSRTASNLLMEFEFAQDPILAEKRVIREYLAGSELEAGRPYHEYIENPSLYR